MMTREANALKIVRLLVHKGMNAQDWRFIPIVAEWGAAAGIAIDELHECIHAALQLQWIMNGPKEGTLLLTNNGFVVGTGLACENPRLETMH